MIQIIALGSLNYCMSKHASMFLNNVANTNKYMSQCLRFQYLLITSASSEFFGESVHITRTFSHTQSMNSDEGLDKILDHSLRWSAYVYRKACVKLPLKNRQNKVLNDKWQLNEGQKYCRMLQESILQYFWPALNDNWY